MMQWQAPFDTTLKVEAETLLPVTKVTLKEPSEKKLFNF